MILEYLKLWWFIEKSIIAPTNMKILALHVKNEGNAKRIILDFVKVYFIYDILDKMNHKLIYDSFIL